MFRYELDTFQVIESKMVAVFSKDSIPPWAPRPDYATNSNEYGETSYEIGNLVPIVSTYCIYVMENACIIGYKKS